MSDTSVHVPHRLSDALDRAAGYACALRALGIHLQDFEIDEAEKAVVSVLGDGLTGALAVIRDEISAGRV